MSDTLHLNLLASVFVKDRSSIHLMYDILFLLPTLTAMRTPSRIGPKDGEYPLQGGRGGLRQQRGRRLALEGGGAAFRQVAQHVPALLPATLHHAQDRRHEPA